MLWLKSSGYHNNWTSRISTKLQLDGYRQSPRCANGEVQVETINKTGCSQSRLGRTIYMSNVRRLKCSFKDDVCGSDFITRYIQYIEEAFFSPRFQWFPELGPFSVRCQWKCSPNVLHVATLSASHICSTIIPNKAIFLIISRFSGPRYQTTKRPGANSFPGSLGNDSDLSRPLDE